MLKRLGMFISWLFVLAIALVIASSGSVYAQEPDGRQMHEVEMVDPEGNIGKDKKPKLKTPCGVIGGVKFNDLDGDGVKDPNEPLLPDWQIVLADQNGNVMATVTTDQNGYYWFTGLTPGTYVVSEINQPGWNQTYPASGSHTVTLGPGQVIYGKNFGNHDDHDTPPLTVNVICNGYYPEFFCSASVSGGTPPYTYDSWNVAPPVDPIDWWAPAAPNSPDIIEIICGSDNPEVFIDAGVTVTDANGQTASGYDTFYCTLIGGGAN